MSALSIVRLGSAPLPGQGDKGSEACRSNSSNEHELLKRVPIRDLLFELLEFLDLVRRVVPTLKAKSIDPPADQEDLLKRVDYEIKD